MKKVEEALAEVERAHPPWHTWLGVGGICYARRPLSSPPRVVRAETPEELAGKIADCECYLMAR